MNFVLEEVFGNFRKDIDVVKERNEHALDVLPTGPALDAYTAFLHEEMRQCYLQGLDHAAIVMACALLEFTIKADIYFEEYLKAGRQFDQAKWNEIESKEFAKLINWAKSLGLISKNGHKMLESFRVSVRNNYMHGSTPKRVKQTKLQVFEGNWQTGEAKIREIELGTDLALQRMYRVAYDRMQCEQVIPFVDQAVREHVANMNVKLGECEKKHPSPVASIEDLDAMMEKMKAQGFDGGMALIREVPDEIRKKAAMQES